MTFVLGVDEAGRGPLAGPVAVGVVCVPEAFDLRDAFPGLNDSKQLSETKREALFATLLEYRDAGTISFCVKSVSAPVIDRVGITNAVKSAVHKGVREMAPDAHGVRVYLDGLLHAPEEYEQETLVRGDAIIPAIMLASVAAKVVRDRYMVSIATQYPGYGFEQHKGYGTKMHRTAIALQGLSEMHRRSFCRNIDVIRGK